MTEQEIDKIAQEAFPQQDLSFEAKYWEEMEALLDKKKKPRGFIFWWGSASIVVLLSSFVIWNSEWLTATNPEELAQYTPRVETTQTASILNNNAFSEELEESSATKQTTSNTNTAIPASIDDEGVTPLMDDAEKGNENVSESENEGGNENGGASDELSVVMATAGKPKADDEVSENPKKEEIVVGTTMRENPAFAKLQNSTSDENTPALQTTFALNQNRAEENSNTATNKLQSELDLLSIIKPTAFELNIDPVELKEVEQTPPDMTTEFGEEVPSSPSYKWFAEAQFDFARYGKNDLEILNNSNTLLTISPSQIESWSGAAHVGISKKNWYVYTGIGYTSLSQEFDVQVRTTQTEEEIRINEREELNLDSSFVRHEIIRVPNGNGFSYELGQSIYDVDSSIVLVQDTSVHVTQTEVHSKESYQYKLQYFKIPLAIGYTYPLKDKWLLEGFAQMEMGILTSSSGTVYNGNDGEFYLLSEAKKASGMTLSYQLGMGFGYFLSPEVSIRLRPSYQQIIQGPFENGNFNRNGFSVGAALRYNF